jgi:preprotein translocase subunit SecF
MNKLVQRSFLNALGTVVYVSAVAIIMQNGEKIFGGKSSIVGPISFLMLFVLSAAITSSLVLGKPLLMYLNDQKSEAVRLFIYTICWLVIAVVILFVSNLR